MQWGNKCLLNKHCRKNWTSHMKKWSRRTILPCTQKLTLNIPKDLKVSPENIKLLEENLGDKILVIGLGDNSLNFTLKIQPRKKEKKIALHKTKKFCTRTKINKLKICLLNGREYFQIITFAHWFFQGICTRTCGGYPNCWWSREVLVHQTDSYAPF